MSTALGISWFEVDELYWDEFQVIVEKLEEIRGREEDAMRRAVSGAKMT